MKKFFTRFLEPGMIVSVESDALICKVIQKVIKAPRSHDALVCLTEDGKFMIGDCLVAGCHLHSLAYYEERMENPGYKVQILKYVGGSKYDGVQASKWWIKNVNGKWYDFMAYPRLFLKALCMDFSKRAAGWEWAWYCTESCTQAWIHGAGKNPWAPKTTNTTPGTTYKRWKHGIFEDVTNKVILDM